MPWFVITDWGLTFDRQNEFCDLTAGWLRYVCHDVTDQPYSNKQAFAVGFLRFLSDYKVFVYSTPDTNYNIKYIMNLINKKVCYVVKHSKRILSVSGTLVIKCVIIETNVIRLLQSHVNWEQETSG